MKAKKIPNMSPDDLVRFISSITFISNECWNWDKTKVRKGYGRFYFKGCHHTAHRVSYEYFCKVELPLEMTLDHKCLNKLCVNPNHLDVVTSGENVRRFRKVRYGNSCKRGHPYSGSNLLIYKRKNTRICKQCMMDGKRKLKARKRL